MRRATDVLEQFNAPPKPAPASSGSQPAQTASSKDAAPSSASNPQSAGDGKKADPFGLEGLDDDFARELTKGMESLFRDIAQGAGLDDVPDLGKDGEGATDEEREKERVHRKMASDSMVGLGLTGLGVEDASKMGLRQGSPSMAGVILENVDLEKGEGAFLAGDRVGASSPRLSPKL